MKFNSLVRWGIITLTVCIMPVASNVDAAKERDPFMPYVTTGNTEKEAGASTLLPGNLQNALITHPLASYKIAGVMLADKKHLAVI
ncbi:MAG: hypothetical protein KDD76_06145, partial [Rickettsiales bacterium]|nr:hypothetical protein [Rickettsiales bacterium]